MNTYRPHSTHLGLLAAVALVTLTCGLAHAEPFNVTDSEPSAVATQPTSQQAIEPIAVLQPEVETIISESIDACHVYKPLVHYRVKGHCPPCCAAAPPIETTMLVKDPAACDCYAEISVCLPCCCVGEASICNREGLLGRRWVDYEWACGFKISVLFRSRGDVVVNYIF